MMWINYDKELFDFGAMVATNFEKEQLKLANVLSMYGTSSNKKYSIHLVKKIKSLIRLQFHTHRIELDVEIAKQFTGEIITHSIIWAHLRPDYEAGINGDIQCDAAAFDILCKYHSGFDKVKFMEQFDKLIVDNGNNTYRAKMAKSYLDSKP